MSPDNTSPATIKNIEDLDAHVTAIVKRTHQELLTELQNTRLEVEKLRMEVQELKEQVPPKLTNL